MRAAHVEVEAERLYRDAALARFIAATPELMARRELLRRVDSKFVVGAGVVAPIIADLADGYAVLRVPGGELATYQSLYFDTPELRCFHDHRRGRRVRHKVRIRHYPDRALSFLEIKTKRNEMVTDKKRRPLAFGEETLGGAERDFLRPYLGVDVERLRPMLVVDFLRLSLIGLETDERVTIDVDLAALDVDGRRISFGGLAVIEVKQSPYCVRTPVMRALLGRGLREQSMSKYTFATALSRPELRRNRLLPELRAIERMTS